MTGAIVFGLIGLAIPLTPTLAREPQLLVSPGAGRPGAQVTVTGAGLPARTFVRVQWDKSTSGMPTSFTNSKGSMKVSMRVPARAVEGVHTVSVSVYRWSDSRLALAATSGTGTSVDFTVLPPPTPGSTVGPPPQGLAAPTPAVTSDPTSTTVPGAQPTADPTATVAPGATGPTETPTVVATTAPTAVPTLNPTAPPTPKPTPNPTAPPPAPTPNPTAPPPDPSCDATLGAGSGDRTNDLKSLVNSVPNGSTICFVPGTYTVNGRVSFSNRSGITFMGPATLKTTTTNRGNLSLFQANSSTSIVYRDLVVDGGRPDPGSYSPSHEFESAFDFRGSSGTVKNVTIRNWGGDAVYVGATSSSANAQSHDVMIRNNDIDGTGRMGVAITAGSNVQITGNSLDHIALQAIDLESNYASHSTSNILVSGNTVRRFGLDPHLTPWFFTADVNAGSANHLTIKDNTFIGSALTVTIGHWSSTRRSDVTITGNTSNFTGKSPAGNGGALMYLWHIDGLTVKNNTQPLASGHFLTNVNDCTGVSVS
jgi:hypothetical protein